MISLLSPSEIEQLNGQISLFGADVPKKTSKQQSKIQTTAPAPEETPIINTSDRLNTEQQKAVSDLQRVVAVIAGPGTGKTKTLVSRIAYLIEEHGVKPEEITQSLLPTKRQQKCAIDWNSVWEENVLYHV